MSDSILGATAGDIIDFLKKQARVLQRSAEGGDASALARIKRQCTTVALGEEIKRKNCLATIARELGFTGWKALVDAFQGEADANFQVFLHPSRCQVFWNVWFASYDEAAKVRAKHGGFLLPYKNQFMVVDEDYIRALVPVSDFCDWDAIGRDWPRPCNFNTRLKLVFEIAQESLRRIT
jgi:hypothetical protein